jgi:hypothetical protein
MNSSSGVDTRSKFPIARPRPPSAAGPASISKGFDAELPHNPIARRIGRDPTRYRLRAARDSRRGNTIIRRAETGACRGPLGIFLVELLYNKAAPLRCRAARPEGPDSSQVRGGRPIAPHCRDLAGRRRVTWTFARRCCSWGGCPEPRHRPHGISGDPGEPNGGSSDTAFIGRQSPFGRLGCPNL